MKSASHEWRNGQEVGSKIRVKNDPLLEIEYYFMLIFMFGPTPFNPKVGKNSSVAYYQGLALSYHDLI